MRSFVGFRKSIAAAVLVVAAAAVGHGQEASVEVDTVRARVRPDVEIELPSGIVEQKSTIPIGDASFTVQSTIDFLTGSIAGDVTLSRFLSAVDLTPFVELGVEASIEPTLVPEASESVDRIRRATVGARWTGGPGSWEVTTEFREDIRLSEENGDSESLDAFPTVAWEISDLRPVLPARTPETVGGWVRIELTQRTHVGTQSAVDLRGRIAALLHHRALDRLRWRHRMEIYSPLAVWNRVRSDTVGLGGFDSIRGFEDGAINTRRGALSANTASFNLGSDDKVGETIDHVRFHSLRALAVGDIALYQDSYSLSTVPEVMAGIGTGLATTLSAPGGIHVDVEAYVAFPIEATPMPVVYVRSSLFSLSTDIDDVDG
ncbi:MAG: hypothetical protein WD492_00995 [Alkalispirochaeta sp.]